MNNKSFMLSAIKEALKSEEPLKCGLVIVKNNKIIAKAGKKLKSKNLSRCIVYGTCEPCTMCLSSLILGKVDTLFCGVTLTEYYSNDIEISIDEVLSKSSQKLNVVL